VTNDYSAAQPMDLTLVAEKLIIQGQVRSRFRRLSDLMNDRDSVHIVLVDATFMEVGTRRVMARAAATQIATDSILFVHTTTLTPSSPDLRQPRRGVRATLLLPPFTVEGNVHLPYESELPIALEAYEGRFVPVTKARYWAYSMAEAPREADLILVNHSRTHISVAPGVEWNPEMPDGKSEGEVDSWMA
jgi:hypothetical protein